MSAVAQLAICRLGLLARRATRNRCDAGAVAVGGAIEHVDEAAMAWQRLGAAARVKIELRENVAAQAGQVNVDPVVAPIDQVGTKGMMLGVGRLERRIERANVARVKGVDELLDVGAIDLDQLAREVGVLLELVDAAFNFFGALIFLADHAARERCRLLENLWNGVAGEVVSALRDDDGFEVRAEPAHRAAVLAMLAAIAERSQLDQTAHRQRIPVRSAELVDGLVLARQQRGEDWNHRMR